MDKNLDPDYRILRCFLNHHDALKLHYEALEVLIARAGPLARPPAPICLPKPLPKPQPLLVREVVAAYAKTMSILQIADIYGLPKSQVASFIRANNIPLGKPKQQSSPIKIEVKELRRDKHFPVPVQIITHAYAEVTTACR